MLNKNEAKKVFSEDAEQITFLNWFKKNHPETLIFHVPNGGHRHKAVAVKMKQLGQVRGVPDLFIPEWFAFIEMKREKGGATSKEQKAMIQHLKDVGYTVEVCKGHKAAIDFVRRIVDGTA